MKRLLLILLLLVCLSGCKSKLHAIDTYQEWDELIQMKLEGVYQESLMYDLRDKTLCEAGHVSGFLCIFYQETLTLLQVESNIEIVYGKDALILLMCEDGTISYELGESLIQKGYRHVYYFKDGYTAYAQAKPNFVPEVGCNC